MEGQGVTGMNKVALVVGIVVIVALVALGLNTPAGKQILTGLSTGLQGLTSALQIVWDNFLYPVGKWAWNDVVGNLWGETKASVFGVPSGTNHSPGQGSAAPSGTRTPAPTVIVVDDKARARALLTQANAEWGRGSLGACEYAQNAVNADPGLAEAQKLLATCLDCSAKADLLLGIPSTEYDSIISAANAVLAINPKITKARELLEAARKGRQYIAEWQVLANWIIEFGLDIGVQTNPVKQEIIGMLAGRDLQVENEGGGLILKGDTDPVYLAVSPDKLYLHLEKLHIYVTRGFLKEVQGEIPKRGQVFQLNVGMIRRPRTPVPPPPVLQAGDCVTGTNIPVYPDASVATPLTTLSSGRFTVIGVGVRVQLSGGAQAFWTDPAVLQPCQ